MKEFVTPEMASNWLDENRVNRNLSAPTYEMYASDMLAGRWLYSPATVVMFGKKTGLLNGQHTLKAIVHAANLNPDFKGVYLEVVRDVDDAVRDVADIGRIRTGGDMLTMADISHGVVANAAAKIVLNWLDGVSIGARRSKTDTVQFVKRHIDIAKAAELASSTKKWVRPAPMAALLYLATRAKDRDGQAALNAQAERFVYGIAHGAELPTDDPRFALVDTLWQNRGDPKANKLEWPTAATVLAWNFYITGRKISRINVLKDSSGEYSIPDIIGAPLRGAARDIGVDAALKKATIPDSIIDLIAEMKAQAAAEPAKLKVAN